MTQLIITILAIALSGAAAYATMYYGSDAALRKQSAITAEALVSQAEQVSTALLKFEANQKRWPNSVQEMVEQQDLTGTAAWGGTSWELPSAQVPVAHLDAATAVNEDVCALVNKLANGIDGIPAKPRTGWRVQCFGNSASTLVVAASTTASAYELAYPAGGSTWPGAESGNPDPLTPGDWFKSPGPRAHVSMNVAAAPGDFGSVVLARTGPQAQAQRSIAVTNAGNAPATITPALSTAPGVAMAAGTCAMQGGSISLAGGSSCNLQLSWTPQGEGVFNTGRLGLTGDFEYRPDQSVGLFGEAYYYDGVASFNAANGSPNGYATTQWTTWNEYIPQTFAPNDIIRLRTRLTTPHNLNNNLPSTIAAEVRASIAGINYSYSTINIAAPSLEYGRLASVRLQSANAAMGEGISCGSINPGNASATTCYTKPHIDSSSLSHIEYITELKPWTQGVFLVHVNPRSFSSYLGIAPGVPRLWPDASALSQSSSYQYVHVANQPTTLAWDIGGNVNMTSAIRAGNDLVRVTLNDTGLRLPPRVRFRLTGTPTALAAFRIYDVFPGGFRGTTALNSRSSNGYAATTCESTPTRDAMESASVCATNWNDYGVSVRIRWVPQTVSRCVRLEVTDERGATVPASKQICGGP